MFLMSPEQPQRTSPLQKVEPKKTSTHGTSRFGIATSVLDALRSVITQEVNLIPPSPRFSQLIANGMSKFRVMLTQIVKVLLLVTT